MCLLAKRGHCRIPQKRGLVQVYGRIGVNAYLSGNNEAKATLTFHVSEIKLFGGGSQNSSIAKGAKTAEPVKDDRDNSMDIDGDLPF
ncbi:hypothetical protein ACFOG5_02460 [Pedobacter fastidiosus]|uniref:hypothetical protein n=1 Tax=Pedobacter fastidiosus TaxID=2765361 RepID=UPI0036121C3F